MDKSEILVRATLGAQNSGIAPAQLFERLAGALRSRPQVGEAYIFGSLATESYGRHSDVDLIVVARTSLPFLERYRDFPELFELCGDLDLLVYTKEEIERLRVPPHAGFWKSVWQQAIRLV